MSALGQKQTFRSAIAMSALPPKADINRRLADVRFVPIADIHELRGAKQKDRLAAVLSEITSGDINGVAQGLPRVDGSSSLTRPSEVPEEIGRGRSDSHIPCHS